jgi:hypothetical protein
LTVINIGNYGVTTTVTSTPAPCQDNTPTASPQPMSAAWCLLSWHWRCPRPCFN